MLTKAQKAEALAILRETYPNAKPALDFTTPFELLVATILSAQSTDVMVNKCTQELFPVANTPEQIAAMTEEELFPYIKRCGFFNTKGRHILETARILVTQYGGEVPASIETLQTLPGVGRKVANLIRGDVFGLGGIVADTHCIRICAKLGFVRKSNPLVVEKTMDALIPREKQSDFCHRLVLFGREICSAKKPKCDVCFLCALCDYRNALVRKNKKAGI